MNENVNITPLETRTHKACAEIVDNLSYKLEELRKGAEVEDGRPLAGTERESLLRK